MATIKKQGKGYQITVSAGYDINGRQIRKYLTWVPEPGMTKRQLEKELNRQIDQLVDTKIEIGKLIEKVHNESYRLLLEKRYLCFLAWDQIAAEMHYSRRWVLNKHERALEVADRLLREKEAQA